MRSSVGNYECLPQLAVANDTQRLSLILKNRQFEKIGLNNSDKKVNNKMTNDNALNSLCVLPKISVLQQEAPKSRKISDPYAQAPRKERTKSYSNLFISQYQKSETLLMKRNSNASDQTESTTSSEHKSFLINHKVKPDHRGRMIDWMIQVLRVLGRSYDKTFFMASSILDRFFES